MQIAGIKRVRYDGSQEARTVNGLAPNLRRDDAPVEREVGGAFNSQLGDGRGTQISFLPELGFMFVEKQAVVFVLDHCIALAHPGF